MIENPHTNRTGIIMIMGMVAVIALCLVVIIFGYKEPERVVLSKSTAVTTEKSVENSDVKSVKNTEETTEYTGKYQKSGKLEKIMQQIADKTDTAAKTKTEK